MDTNAHFCSYLAQFLRVECETFQTKCVENIKTQFNVQYFVLKSVLFMR
jgi:hypothetical protein